MCTRKKVMISILDEMGYPVSRIWIEAELPLTKESVIQSLSNSAEHILKDINTLLSEEEKNITSNKQDNHH